MKRAWPRMGQPLGVERRDCSRAVAAFGPLQSFNVAYSARRWVAAKGCPGGARRADEAACAALRLPCGARVHGPAHNSLRSLRSLRSNRMRQKCLRGSLRSRAMAPVLLGASYARRAPPGQPFATGSGGARQEPPPVVERQAVPGGGAVWGAEQHSLEGGERSELRKLTCRILSERSERSERSELCGTPSRRAAQGSRSEAQAAPSSATAGHRLPRRAQHFERRTPTDVNVRNGPNAVILMRAAPREACRRSLGRQRAW